MRRVLDAAVERCYGGRRRIAWHEALAGGKAIEKEGVNLPEATLDAIRSSLVAIKGPLMTPVGKGARSINVALRQSLDLYACVRPCRSLPGDGSRYRDVDLVIVRENTEDLYAGIEFEARAPEVDELAGIVERSGQRAIRPGSAISIKPISAEGSRRIVTYAFEYARRAGRMRVEEVKKQLAAFGLAERYREFSVSSATVELAAQALDCEPGRIAKSLSIRTKEGPVVLVVMGTARLDNRKFKDCFHQKAAFIPGEALEELIGHPQGGVCPFALPEGVRVYLDESLRAFDPVYPAAGAPNNAVELHLDELERVTGGQWVDVCKAG